MYQLRNNCVIEEFGAVPHLELEHLAASPDGIIVECNDNAELVGRMVEIKCPYSRIPNGIISSQYWIQMQIQMEVCNLELCDFIEAVIKEFPTKEEWQT